jgi:hypothetical protein
MARLLLALLIASPIASLSAQNAGITKVIQMLGDMSAKSKQEKNKEQVAFAEFQTWCKMEIPQTQKAIAKAAENIDLLNAEAAKLTSEAKVLGQEIGKLQDDVATFSTEKKKATAQREKDNKAYIEESTDYGESVDALDRALIVLSKNAGDKPAAAAVLLQLSESDRLPAQAKSMVAAFMGMMGGDFMGEMSPPEANAYESQSGGIIDMLKNLKDDFRSKLAECQKEEMNSKHAYDMVIADLTDSIENSEQTIEEKKITKARKEEKAAADKKEEASTQAMKAEDEKTLSDMQVECKEKQLSFDEKQKLRTEEIAAIQKATEILQAGDVPGALNQLSQGAAFPQLRSAQSAEGFRGRVRDFVAQEAKRLHSTQLSLLAQKLAADPFAKVKGMIDSMITRLLNEANEDAQHEGFCDKEIGKSKVTRNKLSEDIDGLAAAVEDGKATIMSLTEEIATLTQEVADLDASRKEATKMRTEEKASNKASVEDSQAAQKAVAAATAVLKDFYEKASLATGLLQTGVARPTMGSDEWDALANPNFKGTIDKGHKEGMQTFGKKFTGQQDQAGGVMAMLEVVLSDFSNEEADTKAAEAKSQETYDDFMTESQRTKATKMKKIEMDEADKAAAESKLQEDTKDMKGTQDELIAANRYYDKLVPQCIDQGQTFEERTAARESEIASLKQALKIL